MARGTDTRTHSWIGASVLVATCSLCHCSSGPLDAAFATGGKSRDQDEAQEVLAAVRQQLGYPATFAAVGLTGRGVIGRALPDGALWTFDEKPNVLPSLAGDVVAFSHGERVTVLDVKTGIRLFSLDVSGRRLEGLGFNGTHLVLLLVDKDDARPDQVMIVDRRGIITHRTTTMGRVGTPAAFGEVGLIPWDGQYVSAVDLQTGSHIGRLFLANGVHTVDSRRRHPWALGAKGAVPLDERLLADWGERALALDPPHLPGKPRWPVDGSKPRMAQPRSVGLYGYPLDENETLHFSHDTYAYSYYDIVVGFEHDSHDVKWTTHFTRSVVGGDVSRDGPILCLEDGSIVNLHFENGAQMPNGSLQSRLRACVVQAENQEHSPTERPPLPTQIHETIRTTGPDMAEVHELLLDDLGKRDGREITEALLEIARDPLTSARLSERAGNLLARRHSGADLMLEALRESVPHHARRPTSLQDGQSDAPPADDARSPKARPPVDLVGKRRPPLGPLARALTRMEVKKAAPSLALHLNSPSIAGSNALALMHAISELGGREEVSEVREFLMTHRAVGGNEDMIEALAEAAEFALTHDTEEASEALRMTLSDHLTHPDLAALLAERRLLSDPPPVPAPGEE